MGHSYTKGVYLQIAFCEETDSRLAFRKPGVARPDPGGDPSLHRRGPPAMRIVMATHTASQLGATVAGGPLVAAIPAHPAQR